MYRYPQTPSAAIAYKCAAMGSVKQSPYNPTILCSAWPALTIFALDD